MGPWMDTIRPCFIVVCCLLAVASLQPLERMGVLNSMARRDRLGTHGAWHLLAYLLAWCMGLLARFDQRDESEARIYILAPTGVLRCAGFILWTVGARSNRYTTVYVTVYSTVQKRVCYSWYCMWHSVEPCMLQCQTTEEVMIYSWLRKHSMR